MPIDISPDGYMVWWLSALLAMCVWATLVYATSRLVRELLRLRRARREADAVQDQNATLRLGACHVAGVVELAEGVEFAARVEIKQIGSEQRGSKGGWSHSWQEESRKTFSRAFWIRHHSGEKVLVEAAPKVHLVDGLDLTVHDQFPGERYRIAELSRGEMVVAEGSLQQAHDPSHTSGYRDAGTLWVLRPIRGVERLHLSAEALSERHRRRSRKIALGLFLGCFPLLVVSNLVMTGYLARATLGRQETVTIERKAYYTTPGRKGGVNHHYDVHFVSADGVRRRASLDRDDWNDVDQGSQLAMLTVTGLEDAPCLGAHATMDFMAWLFAMLCALGAAGVSVWAMSPEWFQDGAKWYEAGSGRLPTPTPSAIRVYSRE